MIVNCLKNHPSLSIDDEIYQLQHTTSATMLLHVALVFFLVQSWLVVTWLAKSAAQPDSLSPDALRNTLIMVWLAACGALTVAMAVLPSKLWMLTQTWAHLLCSQDKRYKKPADPNTLSDFDAAETEERTVIFIRHGESTWNETFNKSKLPWKFIPRLIKAVLTEVTLMLRRDSWFFDAPLNDEGMEQAEKLHKFISTPLPVKVSLYTFLFFIVP